MCSASSPVARASTATWYAASWAAAWRTCSAIRIDRAGARHAAEELREALLLLAARDRRLRPRADHQRGRRLAGAAAHDPARLPPGADHRVRPRNGGLYRADAGRLAGRLSRHPEVAARLEAELDEVLGGRPPRVEDLPRLPYTERVITESTRLDPPAYAFGREALADCEVGGFDVPAGTTLVIVPWVMHRDPRLVRRSRSVPPRVPGGRASGAAPPLRLPPLRRLTAPLRRQPLRHDGGGAPPRLGRAPLPRPARPGPDAGPLPHDHAAPERGGARPGRPSARGASGA